MQNAVFSPTSPDVAASSDFSGNRVGANLIIVGGAPRSGTSITQAILDCHPAIFGGPEFDCLPVIADARNQTLDALRAGRIADFTNEDQINASFGQLIENLLHPVMLSNGASFLSEKTPGNVLIFDELMEMLPNAKFIEVIRDPRAVVHSMMQVAERFRANGLQPPAAVASLEAATETVSQCIHKGYCAHSRWPDRVFRLKYENLVLDPERMTKALFAFLDLPWAEEVMFPGQCEHPAMDRLRADDGGLWDNVGAIVNLFPSSLDAWRNTMAPAAQAYVSSALRHSQSHLEMGYDFVAPTAHPSARRGSSSAKHWQHRLRRSLRNGRD